jgi:four helix bundle protein
MKNLRHFRDLDVYQGAMDLVMRIFELAKSFPSEERYSLTDQVRRSSRSVYANLAEAWRKRRYEAAFVSKLNDAEAEAAETQVHIEIALRHNYLSQATFEELDDAYDKILAQIVKMIDHRNAGSSGRGEALHANRFSSLSSVSTRPVAPSSSRRVVPSPIALRRVTRSPYRPFAVSPHRRIVIVSTSPHLARRSPNIAVPTRTIVAPSAIATG